MLRRSAGVWSRASPKRKHVKVSSVKRIILVRCGESTGDVDVEQYVRQQHWAVPLTPAGHEQARAAARRVVDIVGAEAAYVYASPCVRAQETKNELVAGLGGRVAGDREDARLRGCDIGQPGSAASLARSFDERCEYGKFFYRFPRGESRADVCDRVSSFLDTWHSEKLSLLPNSNVVIVTDGLTMRLFLMRLFNLTVDTFDTLVSLPFGACCTLDRVSHNDVEGERFRVDEAALAGLRKPAVLSADNGYKHRNNAILGSIAIGAPFL
jgi:broad specificity phosphatase PhoE